MMYQVIAELFNYLTLCLAELTEDFYNYVTTDRKERLTPIPLYPFI